MSPILKPISWLCCYQDYATNRWLDGGCPKEKLIVGIATYGRCFTLTNSAQNGLGAPVKGACMAGTYTREAGFLSYYEVCFSMCKDSGLIYERFGGLNPLPFQPRYLALELEPATTVFKPPTLVF